jgi:hypothetical protein
LIAVWIQCVGKNSTAAPEEILNYNDLSVNFSDLLEIKGGVIGCKDVLPKSTFYYYIKWAGENSKGFDFLVVSENRIDDEFAVLVFSSLPDFFSGTSIAVSALEANKFGFSTLVLAPSNFHGYFKGGLDNKRDKLILCVPTHKSEFCGNESIEEFNLMRREIVPTLDWNRKVSPKISLRFDNPKTCGGTGDSYVLVKNEILSLEIDNLNGVSSGFIEVLNYGGDVIEILSPEVGRYVIIFNRDDNLREMILKEKLLEKIWKFLTE